MSDDSAASMPSQPDRRSVRLHLLALILAGNAIPVLGVLYWGWDAAQIILLYWCENLIVGALTLPRILTARGEGATVVGSTALGVFFSFHYGLFCLVHGVFAVLLATMIASGGDPTSGGFSRLWATTFGSGAFWLTVLAITALQLLIFAREWWIGQGWRTASPQGEMARPYGRIVALHLTVLLGAWLLSSLNAPAWTVLILCAVKAVIEAAAEIVGPKLRLKVGAA